MLDLLKGEDTLKVSRETAIGVVASQPPYPQYDGKAECVEGNPVTGIEDAGDDVHPVMMQIGKGPCMEGGKVVTQSCFQTAGEMVLIMTGLGSTVSAARKAVYGSLDKVSWTDHQFRNDIGCKLESQLPTLHRLGYAKEMSFG